MTKQTQRERFDKAEEAYHAAKDQVNRAHAVWVDACHRMDRIERERSDAFRDLVAGSCGEEMTSKEGR